MKKKRQQNQSNPLIPNGRKKICKGFAEKIWQSHPGLWRNHLQGAWRQLLSDGITKKDKTISAPLLTTLCYWSYVALKLEFLECIVMLYQLYMTPLIDGYADSFLFVLPF